MKRSVFGRVLLGLGAFLLVMGAIARFWAPGAIEKTPLEVDTTTHLEGTAQKRNFSTQELEDLTVRATSITQSDTERSDDDAVAFVTTTCLVVDEGDVPDCVDGDDPRLLNADVDIFATDRTSALPVDDAKYFEETPEAKEGLVNKWPFGVEKKDYDVWDGMAKSAFPATYEGTEDLDGLEVYKFELSVPEQEAEISDGVQGLYSMEKEYWVEPNTGSIIDQTQHEIRELDGDVALDLSLAFTDDTVEGNIDDAKANVLKLTLFKTILPLVGLIGGLLCLALGALLLLRGRGADEAQHSRDSREHVSLGK